jgi:RNA polymerase sigma-70 factor (ECF subfamily)
MSQNQNSTQQIFETLYHEYSDAIFRFCVVRVSDREIALDITQETFTRLWQSLGRGQEMTHARSFIFTIAHRLIIDWYRKRKAVSLEGMSAVDDEDVYEPPQENAKMNIEMESEGRFLVQSISKLSSSYRQSVYLRYVEGLSPGEIGEILNISANAVSVRINRGLDELRRISGYTIGDDESVSHT